LAQRIAEMSQRGDAQNAWVAGLLAPLGWLAVSAIDSDRVVQCLSDPRHEIDANAAEQQHWGLDQAAIARRLLRAWRLPHWLRIVVGHLGLPVEVAQQLGADTDLFRVVQAAVALVQKQAPGLRLPVGGQWPDLAAALGLSGGEQEP